MFDVEVCKIKKYPAKILNLGIPSFNLIAMKKQLQLIAFLACFFAVLFSRAQVPNYQILGPHTEYEGPYYIRIFVNFHQTPTAKWTETVDLAQRAAGILVASALNFRQFERLFLTDMSLLLGHGEPATLPRRALFQPQRACSNYPKLSAQATSGATESTLYPLATARWNAPVRQALRSSLPWP